MFAVMKIMAPSSGKYAYNERYFLMQISAIHKQKKEMINMNGKMRQILLENARA